MKEIKDRLYGVIPDVPPDDEPVLLTETENTESQEPFYDARDLLNSHRNHFLDITDKLKTECNWPVALLSPDRSKIKPAILSEINAYIDEKIKYIDNSPLGLFISGKKGIGKSNLMSSVAIYFLSGAIQPPHLCPSIYYMNAYDLFDLLMTAKSDNEEFQKIRGKRSLYIDNLGGEYTTPYGVTKFKNFIHYRQSNHLRTFISSRFSLSDFARKSGYGEISTMLNDKKFMLNLEL